MAYIFSPADGATVSNPSTIRIGLSGMSVAPACVEHAGTGHLHQLINSGPAGLNLMNGLPATDEIEHFGGGHTEVRIDFPPGTHSLRVLLGDLSRVSHEPLMISEPITFTVEWKRRPRRQRRGQDPRIP